MLGGHPSDKGDLRRHHLHSDHRQSCEHPYSGYHPRQQEPEDQVQLILLWGCGVPGSEAGQLLKQSCCSTVKDRVLAASARIMKYVVLRWCIHKFSGAEMKQQVKFLRYWQFRKRQGIFDVILLICWHRQHRIRTRPMHEGKFQLANAGSAKPGEFSKHLPQLDHFLTFFSTMALSTIEQVPTGMTVSGDGRGCNSTSGRFIVWEFEKDNAGNVQKFAVDFEHHCEGAKAALFGVFRYNSEVGVTPRISVGNSVSQKGNAGTSDAVVTVSLSMPSNHKITAYYTTADGSAKSGAPTTSQPKESLNFPNQARQVGRS